MSVKPIGFAEIEEDNGMPILRLMDEGIVVAPGSAFGAGGEGYIRVALVPNLEECREAIGRWERFSR